VKPEKNAILAYNHSRICISLRQFDRTKFEVLIALLDNNIPNNKTHADFNFLPIKFGKNPSPIPAFNMEAKISTVGENNYKIKGYYYQHKNKYLSPIYTFS
jgi:hypothetical protein